jgi:hypothetical protein
MQARYVNALEGSSSADATLRLPSGAVGTYSTGGCVGQVRRQLYGSVRSAFEDPLVPHDMRYLLGIFLNSDRPYLSALHAWRQCMSAARWDFATPEAAIKSIQMLAATTGASPAEIDSRQVAIAGVDVSCDARSHLRMRISEARAQFARRQPSQIIAQLQRIYITREQAFRLALRVLSS